MKTLRLITILAGVLFVVALSSCRKDQTQPGLSIDMSIEVTDMKDQTQPGLSIDMSIEVTDISAINAMLKISGEGDEPALIRMVSAVPEAEVIETVGSLDNSEAVKSYISGNGDAISLPYSAVLKDLNPETAYFIGVTAYDSDMNVYGYATTTFTTLDLSSITDDALGDPSDAGSLTENELE